VSEEELDAKIAWYRQMAKTYLDLPEDEKEKIGRASCRERV
jgi:hypothetical protein